MVLKPEPIGFLEAALPHPGSTWWTKMALEARRDAEEVLAGCGVGRGE
jgi:hypothetical protein